AAFVQFGADLDEATQKRIERGRRLTELLKQGQYAPLPFEEEACVISAAVTGLLDAVPVDTISRFEHGFRVWLRDTHPEILKTIRETGELSEKVESELSTAIAEYLPIYR
ncbi:MAG: F0F1 ATP synthase subunit alpha, partial [Parcubacteria group bacterium]|nr:F0F1 ATP synthase subunit alpha [Parcubacteria group bacterium]